jgi:hypothetical protein
MVLVLVLGFFLTLESFSGAVALSSTPPLDLFGLEIRLELLLLLFKDVLFVGEQAVAATADGVGEGEDATAVVVIAETFKLDVDDVVLASLLLLVVVVVVVEVVDILFENIIYKYLDNGLVDAAAELFLLLLLLLPLSFTRVFSCAAKDNKQTKQPARKNFS